MHKFLKNILLLISFLFIPFNVLGYSDYIIPGGETLGIKVNSKGVMVVGFYEVNNKFNKGTPVIKVGDYITHVNNIVISSVDDLTEEIKKSVNQEYVNITLTRNGKAKNSRLYLIKENNTYKTGLYVKDSITGSGTLTYIDPETKIYGALGHEIVDSSTSKIVEIKSGEIFRNYITSIDKSRVGYAGSKNAKFYYETKYGTILKNTSVGIYGIYNADMPDKELIGIASKDEIKIGNATIQTVLSKEEVKSYDIEIVKIDEYANTKNIYFKITSDELINESGGIVQGMSGSPIIQNNKIIGAVTHVIIDNPLTGYGVFITTMLNEGEK